MSMYFFHRLTAQKGSAAKIHAAGLFLLTTYTHVGIIYVYPLMYASEVDYERFNGKAAAFAGDRRD